MRESERWQARADAETYFPLKKSLQRRADRARAAERLEKGDVAGHDFHGNQYGDGGGKTMARDTAHRLAADHGSKFQAEHPEASKAMGAQAHYVASKTETGPRGHELKTAAASVRAGTGTHAEVRQVGQYMKDHPGTGSNVAKGDAPGHEFHGNQYGGGGGKAESDGLKAGSGTTSVAHDVHTTATERAGWTSGGKGSGTASHESGGKLEVKGGKVEARPANGNDKSFHSAQSAASHVERNGGGGPSSPTDKGGSINRVDAAERMYGTGSLQHEAAIARYGK